MIQFQPGCFDQVVQVPVIGGAGDGSSDAGLYHEPRKRDPSRGRVVCFGNLIQGVEEVPSPVVEKLAYASAAGLSFGVFFTAVLAGEKARRQRVVGNYAQGMLLHHGQKVGLEVFA